MTPPNSILLVFAALLFLNCQTDSTDPPEGFQILNDAVAFACGDPRCYISYLDSAPWENAKASQRYAKLQNP